MTLVKHNAVRVALVTLAILTIPLVLTLSNPTAHINGGAGGGWDWSPGDFVVMGAMIFGTGLLLDWTIQKGGKNRFIIAGVIMFLFVWLWAELAVGVFTNWGS